MSGNGQFMGSNQAFLIAFLSTQSDPLFVNLGTDWRVLGFTAGLAMTTCILFGLAPAVRATAVAPGAVLKAAGRGLTAGRDRFGLRRVLVIAQVALPIAGILSPLPAAEVAAAQKTVQDAAIEIGLFAPTLTQPLFQVMLSSLACLPGPHVTDVGLIDGTTGEVVATALIS